MISHGYAQLDPKSQSSYTLEVQVVGGVAYSIQQLVDAEQTPALL